jgi:hypothetical protein
MQANYFLSCFNKRLLPQWTPCAAGDVKISGAPVPTAATVPMACSTSPVAGVGASLVDYLTIMGGVSYPLSATVPALPLTSTSSLSDRFCDVTWPQNLPNAYVRCKAICLLNHRKLKMFYISLQLQFGPFLFILKQMKMKSHKLRGLQQVRKLQQDFA